MSKVKEISPGLLCPKCREKISEMSNRLSSFDMIRPKRTARKFRKALCGDCERRIKGELER